MIDVALPSAQPRLKALSLRRRQLVEMIAMEKARLKQADEPLIVDSLRAAIADLSTGLAHIEAEVAQSLAADPSLARRVEILTSITGIGVRVATLLVTDLPELGQADRKVIASLAGLAPHVSHSGTASPRAAISGARACVRAALYLSALIAARHNPNFKPSYVAMRQAGKPAKVALVAIARKLVVVANAMIKADVTYQNTYNRPLTIETAAESSAALWTDEQD